MTTFATLGVPDDLCDALDAHHILAPFDIQTATIPPALAGRDVAGRAPTGSGKTLAFGVPLVANVERARPKYPRALVLVPTRELAAQVARDLVWLGADRGTRVQSFYGGVGFEKQIKALRRGVEIAVACPGRLTDLINRGLVRLDDVDQVVVDEADRMADMGFLPEVKRLLDATDPKRQTLLFSATLDGAVDVLVRRYQNDPVRHDVVPEETDLQVTHHHWLVDRSQRVDVTAALIKQTGPTIVFSRTRHGSDRLARQLGKHGVRSAVIHGNRSQNQRTRALADFTSGRAHVLVATDVAARGIHVDDVACVVHFDLPADPKDYVHRSGRTGRAGAQGHVVALVANDQRKDAHKLARALELDVTPGEPDLTLPVAPPGSQHKAVSDMASTKSSRNRSGSSAKSRGDNRRNGGGGQRSHNGNAPKRKSGGKGASGKPHSGPSRGARSAGAGGGGSRRARGPKQHSGRPS